MTAAPHDRGANMSDLDFRAVRDFVESELGIQLSDSKKALVVSRLGGRLRALQFRTYREYLAFAMRDGDERQRLVDAMTTNETRFFRETSHFDLLQRDVIPSWRAEPPRRLRVWSAGCSTGEEPYSIAMLLLDGLPAEEGWTCDVLATDVSARVLAKAEAGIYPIARKDELPDPLLRRYFHRGVGARDGLMRVTPELRAAVMFAPLNLMTRESYPSGTFDAIFCRNVLIYFSAESRRRIVDAMLARLAPGGLFFLGHAESLSGHRGVRAVIPNVYSRAE